MCKYVKYQQEVLSLIDCRLTVIIKRQSGMEMMSEPKQCLSLEESSRVVSVSITVVVMVGAKEEVRRRCH